MHVAVYMIFIRGDKVLLLRRFNTGWKDGFYGLPSGHADGNERVTDAAIREAKEEAGIFLREEDVRLVHISHRKSTEREYVDFFFLAEKWDGEPQNTEPDKCDDLSWFPIDSLPENILPYVRHAVTHVPPDLSFFEFGWNGETN